MLPTDILTDSIEGFLFNLDVLSRDVKKMKEEDDKKEAIRMRNEWRKKHGRIEHGS